ncbi:hypothetical protein KVT40_006526 [Elsinoe batatas]|uniref:Uncharacterized protein n=1 Tax=Elsinoe batatas TaxID=2601811 RepID=A0A8K0L291_9PEZI|nr:hypothetical protein KVT40_006526 [Elsinoe batatas]
MISLGVPLRALRISSSSISIATLTIKRTVTTNPAMQAVKDKLAENFTGPAHSAGSRTFSLDDVPDLSGKVAVVTGGSEGKTGKDALEAIEEELGADARNKVVYIQNDHFGHEVITSHLLPTLKKTADAGHTVRIVNLSSNLHESCPSDTEFKSVEEINKDYGPNAQYSRSKLANLLHARYLHRHLNSQNPKILINATHPGIVDTAQTTTHIHEAYPLLGYGMSAAMKLKPFQKSQFEGACSTMYAATVTNGSGQYICPPAIVEKGSDKSNDEQLQDQLMKITREIIEEKTRPESSAKGCSFKDACTNSVVNKCIMSYSCLRKCCTS